MSNHITINGRTFASVEEMPADLRRQYEAAMQMLVRNSGGSANASDADVDISTKDSGPAGGGVQTVARMTTHRLIVNGKECDNPDEIPAEIRAALRDSALADENALSGIDFNLATPQPITRSSGPREMSPAAEWRSPQNPTFDSTTSVTLARSTLLVLLLVALLIGIVAGAFIGGSFVR